MKYSLLIVTASILWFPDIAKSGGTTLKSTVNSEQWLKNQAVLFLENKGQMTDMDGRPVPFVLFKASAGGIDMYITEKGLTYIFIKSEEEYEEDEEHKAEERKKFEEEENRTFNWSRIDMALSGASIKKENITKEGMSAGFSQYFLAHCADGITDVHNYEKLIISEIYPGIDWVLYNTDNKGFKYDFIVHPGADPRQIELVYSSLKPLKLNRDGAIEIKTKSGTLTEKAPVSYQSGKEISTQFIKMLNKKNINDGYDTHIQFVFPEDQPVVGNAEGTTDLIIDPQLVWATFYAGTGATGPMSVDCDAAGNVFVTGYVQTSSFPTMNPGGTTYFQGTKASTAANYDAFIFKFSNTGVHLWSTYYGGSTLNWGHFIHTDLNGNIFVTGYTTSTNFPVWNPGGGAYFQGTNAGGSEAFILKFSNAGARLWATYYGGSGTERGHSIATDLNGNVFVTGYTDSPNLPVLNPAGGTYFQGTQGGGRDAFIVKYSNSNVLLWATYYGGSAGDEGNAVCTDTNGNLFVSGFVNISTDFPVLDPGGGAYFQGTANTGQNAFILKFSNTGTRLWATYYGGGSGSSTRAYSICTDQNGNLYVTGRATTNLPLLNPGGGAYFQGTNGGSADAFILKFTNSGVRLWASYYGGSADEYSFEWTFDNIVADNCNNIYMSFNTQSPNMPLQSPCSGFYDSNFNDANAFSIKRDIFIVKFNNSGVRLWATHLGGKGNDFREALAVDRSNNFFITGEWTTSFMPGTTDMTTYPVTNPGNGAYYDGIHGGGDDAFIAKFIPSTLILTPASTSAGCSCSGTATLTATGGCSSYKYKWYNNTWSQIGSVQNIINLCEGNYQVIVRDTINCGIDTAFITITGGGALTLNISQNNLTCNGDNNGSATISTNGGALPYTYSWSNAQTTQTTTGLAQGKYTITVTDSGGCTSTATATIISPPPITGQFTKGISAGCAGCGCKQWILVNATGGTAPYNYTWPDGYVNRYKNRLCPGSYSINIKDKNGCTVNINLTTP